VSELIGGTEKTDALPTQGEHGWFLPRRSLTELAAQSLDRLIAEANQSHICDVRLRLGGEDVWREADWIKYLQGWPA